MGIQKMAGGNDIGLNESPNPLRCSKKIVNMNNKMDDQIMGKINKNNAGDTISKQLSKED